MHITSNRARTYGVVDVRVPNPPDVLHPGRDCLRTAKEHQSLVDRVRREVVREPIARQGLVLPGAFEARAEAVETRLELPERAERVRVAVR